jgi:DNA-binding NarL/FixJ family response regulator
MRYDREGPRRTAVILDPQPLCHVTMKTLLPPMNVEVVGATTSICNALTLLREHRPDLLVLEVDIPDAREEALRLIERACSEDPELTVVVLSGADERLLIDAAFDCGARAYVLKTAETDVIATAISQAFEPSLYLSRPKDTKAKVPGPDPALLHRLTRREIEILKLVSGGRSNRQVAEILYVTDQTVKFHLANVYRKLGVRSRFEASRWAYEQGLVEVASADVVQLPKAASSRTTESPGVLVPLRPAMAAGGETATGAGETSR